MDQSFQENNLETLFENQHSNSPRTESFLKTPVSMDSKINSKTHTRFSSEVEYPYKDLIKKMQDEIDALRQENSELKSRENFTGLGNKEIQSLVVNQNEGILKEYNSFEMDNKSKSCSDLQNRIPSEELALKAEQLKQIVKDQENSIANLNVKINYLDKSLEVIEKENKNLKEEVKKRENYLQQKLQLEINIKKMQRENQEIKSEFETYKNDFKAMEEKSEENEKISLRLNEELQNVKTSYNELQIEIQSLKDQKDFFEKEAVRKDKELLQQINYVKKIEEELQEVHRKLTASQGISSKLLIQSTSKENIIETKTENFVQNKTNISKLVKENQTSKEVNQTLIKLLKLKNVQIQTIKILYDETGNRKLEAQRNLDKFQNEEKKLHRMYNLTFSFLIA